MAFELLFRPGRNDQIGYLRRKETSHLTHTLDFADLVGGALFKVLVQVVEIIEESCVLDGDDGLCSKILDQLDLLVRERKDLLSKECKCTDKLVFLEHRKCSVCPGTGVFTDDHSGIACRSIEIMRFVHDVSNLNRLFCRHHTSERRLRWGADQWMSPCLRNNCLRCTMHCNSTKGLSFASIQNAELGLADASRILQHRLEHRL